MKFLIKYFILFGLLIAIWRVNGQQLNQLSMTQFHPYKDFSSYAGFDRTINLTLLTRNQWNELPGDPKSRYLGVHLPYYVLKAGFGLDISSINEGNFGYRSFRISANKVLETPIGIFSFGGRIGLHNVGFDLNSVTTPEGTYQGQIINHNDLILLNNLSGVGVGWEASMWYRNQFLQGGLSIMDVPTPILSPDKSRFMFDKNLVLFLGTYYNITKNVQIQPSINLKTNFLELQSELAGVLRINGNIFGGLIFRGYSSKSLDALGIMLGHRLNKRYSIYYNYDAGLSALRRTNEGSHEIIFRMEFYNLPGTGIPPNIIYNPRFLD